MKKVILLLALAGVCAAQTSPTIVKTVNLSNETQLAGSLKSPVAIFTPAQNGFYRMTLYINPETGGYIQLCPSLMGNPLLNECVATTPGGSQSVIFAFGAKAGSAIGFYTDSNGVPYTGTYNINLVLELLSEAAAAN
jgi:hypothetical protein